MAARELAEITPVNAFASLKGNLYRTHAQNASAKNFLDTTERISMEVRKSYPEIADEMLTGMRATVVMPTLPRKPRKRKKQKKMRKVKDEVTDVKVEDSATKGLSPSPRKGPPPPPPSSATKVFEVESDSSDSSFDSEYEEEMYEYDVEMDIYNDEKKEGLKVSKAIRDGRKYAKGVILAQCTREMREKLTTKDTFEEVTRDSDIVSLLRLIKTCGLDFSDDDYLIQNAVHVLRDLLTYTQERHSSNHDYREGLDTRVQKFEQMGGRLSTIFSLKDDVYSKCSPNEIKERIMAVIMIDQSCEERFGDFKKERNRDAHLGRNDFPATRNRAAVALDNHCDFVPKAKPSIGNGGRDDATSSSSFVQYPAKAKDGSDLVKGKDGGLYPHIQCHNCNRYGHYKGSCPKKRREKKRKNEDDDDESDEDDEKEGLAAFGWTEDADELDSETEYGGESGNLNAFTFGDTRSDGSCFSTTVRYRSRTSGKLLILLDTGATHHLFCNGALLRFIGTAANPKVIVTNAGKMNVDEEGVFPGVGTVYYHPRAVINVLSLGMIESEPEKFCVRHSEFLQNAWT